MQDYYFEISENCYFRISGWDFWNAVEKSKKFIDVSNLRWFLKRDLPKNVNVVFSLD